MVYQNLVNFTNILPMNYKSNIRDRKALNLRRIREKLGLKQRDIAEIINANESNVSEMERGKRSISERVINLLCGKFNIDPIEFYYTDEMKRIANSTEQRVIERMRATPEIADQIDVISEAIASRSYGEKQFRRQDSSIQEKKKKRKPA